ncbi:hypothetical protein PsorP6_008011 [Peronosclerospora sorghi]|uniref:Uncharacterized protein n=1 Tax=Peronosclerospora sorghi TaxID=230839 RepID=A0ACC0W8V6_9STRA|nr:hypothetical protein PsorP6_008011 [Peronosclerospora sorghi]
MAISVGCVVREQQKRGSNEATMDRSLPVSSLALPWNETHWLCFYSLHNKASQNALFPWCCVNVSLRFIQCRIDRALSKTLGSWSILSSAAAFKLERDLLACARIFFSRFFEDRLVSLTQEQTLKAVEEPSIVRRGRGRPPGSRGWRAAGNNSTSPEPSAFERIEARLP